MVLAIVVLAMLDYHKIEWYITSRIDFCFVLRYFIFFLLFSWIVLTEDKPSKASQANAIHVQWHYVGFLQKSVKNYEQNILVSSFRYLINYWSILKVNNKTNTLVLLFDDSFPVFMDISFERNVEWIVLN